MSFDNLGLAEPILRAIAAEGYQTATPIQAEAIPHVVAGRDLVGCAQTGTGKTAAFALPTLQRLLATGNPPRDQREPRDARDRKRGRSSRKIRSLVLSPTRELACQIGASFACYGRHTGLRATIVYGGVSQNSQVRALQAGVDVLVATPGRLLDLMQQGYIDLSTVEILTLDEADRMLDMGFLPDLRRIIAKVPRQRQTLMFSATMPDEIRQLAAEWLCNPAQVKVPAGTSPLEIDQSVYFIEPRQKSRLLVDLLRLEPVTRTLVFTRTKHGADKVVQSLQRGGIAAAAIHGNKSQATRQRVLAEFKSDLLAVLVATDIAARGLDIDHVSHVVNYDLPEVPETYVHRIGRTGRAGASGIALSFCGREERSQLRLIERLTRQVLAVQEHAYEDSTTTSTPAGSSDRPTAGKGPKSRWQRRASDRFGFKKGKGKSPAQGGRPKKQSRRRASAGA